MSNPHEVGASSGSSHRQFHVLVVDDSPVDRKIIEKLLIKTACMVTTAESVERAFEILGLEKNKQDGIAFNMIITDYSMGNRTGLELLKKVKESSSRTLLQNIPIVFLSSETNSELIKSCMDAGAVEFLQKPARASYISRIYSHIN